MNDSVIDAIRRVDPCPAELAPPPIETVRRRLGEEQAGSAPPVSPRRPGLARLALILSSATAVAVAVLAIALLGHAWRVGSPAVRGALGKGVPGVPACRPQVQVGVLPVWARAGFSDSRPQMPYVLGRSGRIAAILWGTLDSPPAADHNNKILWVSRVPVRPGDDLTIRAQRMAGSDRLGGPVDRTVTGGPGPSIVNLPAAGCWRLTLRWSGWTDHIDLRYTHPA